MSKKEFLLFLNANGIPYKVCKMLRGTIREIELSCHVHTIMLQLPYGISNVIVQS